MGEAELESLESEDSEEDSSEEDAGFGAGGLEEAALRRARVAVGAAGESESEADESDDDSDDDDATRLLRFRARFFCGSFVFSGAMTEQKEIEACANDQRANGRRLPKFLLPLLDSESSFSHLYTDGKQDGGSPR